MTDYRSLYDKEFIGAWDLDAGDRTITITRVVGGSLTSVGGRKSKKPVVYFSGSDKGFAVNATNGKTIAGMYGNHVEKWIGKQITLYKSTTRSPQGDGDVECIRVRPEVKKDADRFDDQPKTKVSEQQLEEIHTALSEAGLELAALLTKADLTDLGEMAAADAPGAIAWIKRQGEKRKAKAA